MKIVFMIGKIKVTKIKQFLYRRKNVCLKG